MDNINYFYFYVSLPLCIVLLWFWKTHIRGNGFDRSAWILGFTMLAGLFIVAPVLPLTRYMPGFVIHRGYFFSYLNGTFNSFFMAYAVLNFHTADNPRIIPISLGFLVMNVFVSNWLNQIIANSDINPNGSAIPRKAIVVIPGVGGSVLKNSNGENCWIV